MTDALYSLNDLLSEWAADQGLDVTDEQLNDATHIACALLRGEATFAPEKKPSVLQRWMNKNK